MQGITIISKIGVCFGFLVAVSILAYGYLKPQFVIDYRLLVFACPSSIFLIGFDNSKWYVEKCAELIVVVSTAAWYGIWFGTAESLFRRKQKGRSTP
jgi:hypothetical protein